MRLTDAAVAELTVPEGKTEIIVFDDMLAGFGVRVRRGGSKRYVYQYKLSGVNRRVTFKETNVKRARAQRRFLPPRLRSARIRRWKRRPPTMPLETPSEGASAAIWRAPRAGDAPAR